MPYSNCCGAFTNMEELGICPDCKDHCEFYDKCEKCNGLGVYEDELCPVCRGEGVVDCIPYSPKFTMKPTTKE
jgi:DnaJ-class molecular chaperone